MHITNLLLTYRLDFLIFAVLALSGMMAVQIWLRKYHQAAVPVFHWLLLFIFISMAGWLSEVVGNYAKKEMKAVIQGFAPTYAQEMERSGHYKINLETPSNDPLYLSLIQSQIRWLKVNTFVNDIYTFRKRQDGKVILVVDSETDYDHNGKYEGERESRTVIGEVFSDSDEMLDLAFGGEASFDDNPYTDRWGTWVSAYYPLKDAAGKVEGVLGVDYSASEWIHSILVARGAVLGFIMILILLHFGDISIVTVIRTSEAKFKALSDLAPIGIYLTDNQGRCLFVNREWCRIAEMREEEALGEGWVNILYPEDKTKILYHWKQMIKTGDDFTLEYRYQTKSGKIIWVAGHAIAFQLTKGKTAGYIGVAADITERKLNEADREKLIAELKDALNKVKTLKGLLPICAACKKIRDDKGYWSQIEVYIRDRSEADFSHGICPECAHKLYGV